MYVYAASRLTMA